MKTADGRWEIWTEGTYTCARCTACKTTIQHQRAVEVARQMLEHELYHCKPVTP